MSNERRRYFRIDETVGITYQLINGSSDRTSPPHIPDILDLIAKQDKEIEKLLSEVTDENPKIAKLIGLVNQKVERVVSHIRLESSLVGRIAHKVKEANISACGIAFHAEEKVPKGTRLHLDLTLYPEEVELQTQGFVVSCNDSDEPNKFYWRVDFLSMSEKAQERLIQHIVQSQGVQLNTKWENDD